MTTDLNVIKQELKDFHKLNLMIYNIMHVKYLTIKDNQEYFYKGGKFEFGNDCVVLCNGSNNWSVKKYLKDKDGNILYSSKFFDLLKRRL